MSVKCQKVVRVFFFAETQPQSLNYCKMRALLFFVVVTLFAFASSTLILRDNVGRAYTLFWNGIGPSEFNTSGILVKGNPSDDCQFNFESSLAENNTSQVFVFLSVAESAKCSFASRVRRAQTLGASGVIISSDVSHGYGRYTAYNGRDKSDITIITGEINRIFEQEIISFLEEYTAINISLSPDENPWEDQQLNQIFFSIIFGCLNFGGIIFAIIKLRWFIIAYGVEASVAQLVMILEMIGCTARLIWLIHPTGADRNIYPFLFNNGIVTLSFPFSLSAALLISFYWQESCGNLELGKVMPSIQRFKYFVYGIVVGLILMELITIVIRVSVTSTETIIGVTGVIYMIITFCVATFFLVTGIRLVRFLSKGTKVRRLVGFIVTSSVGLYFWFASAVMVSSNFRRTTGGIFIVMWIAYSSLAIITFSHLGVFRNPNTTEMSSESKTKENEPLELSSKKEVANEQKEDSDESSETSSEDSEV